MTGRELLERALKAWDIEIEEGSTQGNKLVHKPTGKRLIAAWTPEVCEDLQRFHHIDGEKELTLLTLNEVAKALLDLPSLATP